MSSTDDVTDAINANPLNEHDYCSPTKQMQLQQQKQKQQQQQQQQQQQSSKLQSQHQQQPETREKRQRKEVHDPEFSHYTSSDYSESDVEDDGQQSSGEEYDDDDPNRPWCSCNKPDDGRFMISCDGCEYWYHGSCVGVTKSLEERWQKEGREWHCSECDDAIQNGTPKNEIPKRVFKKQKTSSKASGKRRGRPRKSVVQAGEASTRSSLRNSRKANTSLDSRMSSRKNSTKSTGSESFNEFEHPDRLKELIRERRKAFFLKHRLSEQLKAEKMKEMGVGRRSMTASLGDSLDSLVTNTNSPNMNNLPINIKSEHNGRSKPNIVLQINTKKDSSSESSGQRLVTTIVKKRKHSEVEDTNKPAAKSEIAKETPTKSVPISTHDPLAILDTTKDHKSHVFDMGCKICTKQQTGEEEKSGEADKDKDKDKDKSASQAASDEVIVKNEPEPEKAQDQPKRLRISIDTKLDPSILSRLREPLIKPTDTPTESNASNLTKSSPNADPAEWHETEAGETKNGEDEDEGDDGEELYDPETSTMPSSERGEFEFPTARDGPCWSGTINMQDVGKFDAAAKSVSGNVDFIRSKMSQTLTICGRIAPDQVTSYIKKIKSTTKNQILLVQLHPLTENDKSSFDAFFDYLYTRNRCAVINCSAYSRILKDFYILPIHEKSNIPDILKPINGPGLDRSVPNCLLGLLVKTKRPSSASGSAMAGYAPASI